MTSPSLSIGIIGAGSIAQLHVQALVRAGHRLTAVCDLRADSAAELAEPHGASLYPDHRALLKAPDLDAVIIAAPHALHAPMALDAIAAGKHVLVEKPIAVTVAEAAELIAAADAAGVILAVGHVLRFVPSLIAAEQLLRAGRIGDPVLITERRASNYAPGSRPDWFFDPEIAGGGILLNVGTHAIDRIQWFGAAPISRVTCFAEGRPDARVETEVAALLELENGVRGSLTLTGTGLPFTEQITVVGSRGALTIDRQAGVRVYIDGEPVESIQAAVGEMEDAFAAQYAAFADAVGTGTPPVTDGSYGLGVLAVAEALYASAHAGAATSVAGVRVAETAA